MDVAIMSRPPESLIALVTLLKGVAADYLEVAVVCGIDGNPSVSVTEFSGERRFYVQIGGEWYAGAVE
jgi:hypothetical protein